MEAGSTIEQERNPVPAASQQKKHRRRNKLSERKRKTLPSSTNSMQTKAKSRASTENAVPLFQIGAELGEEKFD